ncbi:anillin-like isoform X2 [Mercenaria mercenaria]|uniref:anillin-like isoform X2 n=1 Tax=Mercenaria mercenaria TaxID=6596 RepID=UPI00234EA4CE|nr:anillin-like isoform X2 [Mercenaria mercenaria]
MDPYTEQLLERTRQRRAMLNQKLGKTPDPAPRKRVLEDTTNMPVKSAAVDDDSPKRQCTWDDGTVKADTPAIPSVKSRLHALSSERMNWSDTNSAENELPKQPVFEPQNSPASSPVNRKSRFAKLAQNLDDFECDMSHPTVKKQEEKKPRWQPPQRDSGNNQPHNDARDRHVSSPRKEYELYQGPKRINHNSGPGPAPSPKKKEAPAPPAPPVPQNISGPPKPPRAPSPARAASPKRTPAPSAPSGSPKVSTHTIQLQQPQSVGSPKYTHQVRTVTNQVPVNRKDGEQLTSGDEPTSQPVTERLATWKKAVDTPNKGITVNDPTELPLSERFAGWEQRVSQTPVTDKAPISRTTAKPKQIYTPAKDTNCNQDDSEIKPISDIRSSWKQQDAKNNPPRESEPTAFSVTERMSAWETMTSANKVSYIKKVDPGSPGHSPTRPSGSLKPAGTPNRGATWKPSGTPNKGLTPQKSFKDSIEEKAAQLGRKPSGSEGLPPRPPTGNTRSPVKPVNSPSKTNQSPVRGNQSPIRGNQSSPNKTGSPNKVGSATKSLQQKILEQVQYSKTDQLADKLRQERMAEVNALNNRYQNGILRDDRELPPPAVEQTCPPPPERVAHPVSRADKKTSVREKAREDFNKKLQAMGFELSDEGGASYNFKNGQCQTLANGKQAQGQASAASKKPSIYRLVSKKCQEQERPVVQQHSSSSSLKKVQFQEHNTSTESDSSTDRHEEQCTETEGDTMDETDDFDPPSEDIQSETQESFDDSFNSGSESSIPESYRSPPKRMHDQQKPHTTQSNERLTEDDDISLSAFVPASVRRESMLPPRQEHDDTTSITSEDSMDYVNTEQTDRNRQRYSSQESSEAEQTYKKQRIDSTEDSEDEECDRAEMDDLLDEAMDDISEVEMRKKEPQPVPRKRRSYMHATMEGDVYQPEQVQMRPKTMPPQSRDNKVQYRAKSDGLAYSVSMYRSNRMTKITTTVDFREMSQEMSTASQRISRHSHYVHEDVKEEDIKMPNQLPPDVQRKTLHERIKELQELVSQEQSVIMQTSNALNKCCSGDSQFAGSAEQVECNRLLLVSCQRRQAYLTEMQRLKETKQLDAPNQQGPKGSLTISDIRLPLKKDFVTKIGTSSDNTVHYFMLLIRNGPQVITTQMLSTHDPMMRGSLDFPNLIKIHGISSNFNINLEIYSMYCLSCFQSVSREHKDKKKKTPKKTKHTTHIAMESPGGPTAVRTTSFTLITSLPITMKSLDKSSFALERIPFLSPLHGMIYMRLKCMMEQNVEERGFLTMFEDVSGLGAWHRRWIVLTGNKLCFWKYPDDETRKDPMGIIDLKRVITEKVGLIPRDICARPHTFELVSVRPPRRGEQDTLVTKTYNTMTTTRFMLSADTKEERIVWCNKVNRALANLRTWHADAMRPIKAPK